MKKNFEKKTNFIKLGKMKKNEKWRFKWLMALEKKSKNANWTDYPKNQ